jgi:hypothetical protein
MEGRTNEYNFKDIPHDFLSSKDILNSLHDYPTIISKQQ